MTDPQETPTIRKVLKLIREYSNGRLEKARKCRNPTTKMVYEHEATGADQLHEAIKKKWKML